MRLSLVNFVDVNEAADEVCGHTRLASPEVPSSLGRYRLSEYLSGEFQATLRAEEPFIVCDSATDPRTNAERFAELRMAAFVCTPLVRDGHWRFMVAIHHSEPWDLISRFSDQVGSLLVKGASDALKNSYRHLVLTTFHISDVVFAELHTLSETLLRQIDALPMLSNDSAERKGHR